ncbi:MAG: alpha/beta fold hydrolase, partial [Anaerolineae bacterium]
MSFINVNGVDLYYKLHGPEDAPVLALVNGVLMSTASWAYQTPVLLRHYRLLLHDCRGQGRSD